MTTPEGGFDMSGFDMNGLLAQAQAVQAQLAQAQQELAAATFDGSAGGGVVTATVNGSGELQSLSIKPEVVDPEDVETLSDLIVAAVRDASAKATAKQADLVPKIPGLGF
ncbi:YbaB/EbfC family nucleoid-associated protein [Acidipropionibacterium virtanenii]|uniref:Nucleoid-associated protein JS278_02697 n=1 Tax=Acidipropionibacterium virtanenii TaxID=2057246 RepID=A0A344UX35_9ACTN|nr:YbaB/EbfC family nucleoid-associated protein [Acidipropionibacterium virtanenii]AXE39833.1 Nucleoid-associated protein [Acidipropionibacterium virtanenii]